MMDREKFPETWGTVEAVLSQHPSDTFDAARGNRRAYAFLFSRVMAVYPGRSIHTLVHEFLEEQLKAHEPVSGPSPDAAKVRRILDAALSLDLGYIVVIGRSPHGRLYVQSSLEHWEDTKELLKEGRANLKGYDQ